MSEPASRAPNAFLADARHEAMALADALPGVLLDARRLSAAAAGAHGRRRSGQGEAFWQFRDHRPEDGARLVDWRRSARGDRLFVREREREAAQSALFWLDPDPGFAFASQPAFPSKARRALTLALAMALLAARGGERVGALGGDPARTGAGAVERLAHALVQPAQAEPAKPAAHAALVYASDFYAPIEIWRARLALAAKTGGFGALLMVSDPSEDDFPFEGRTQFDEPGGAQRTFTLGRAESAKAAYAQRLAAHRADLRRLAETFGFTLIAHRTDRPAAPALSALSLALAERR